MTPVRQKAARSANAGNISGALATTGQGERDHESIGYAEILLPFAKRLAVVNATSTQRQSPVRVAAVNNRTPIPAKA